MVTKLCTMPWKASANTIIGLCMWQLWCFAPCHSHPRPVHFDPLCASAKMIRSRRQSQVTKLAGIWWCYRLPGFCTKQVQSTSAREGQANSDRQWHKDSRCMKYVAQPSLELVICLGSKCRDVYIQNCVAHPVLKQFCSFTLACRQRLCSSWNAWESECASCYRVQQVQLVLLQNFFLEPLDRIEEIGWAMRCLRRHQKPLK